MPSEATLIRTIDLWHRAGRAAGDDRKRFLALQGVLWSVPVLVLGAFATHVLTVGFGAAFEGLKQPYELVVAPLRGAYEADADLALFGYVLWQAFLLCLLWGFFGGALDRLAAVDLALGRSEEGKAAAEFARRHWRGNVGARLAIWGAFLAPLVAAVVVALVGRIGGPIGTGLLAAAVLVATALTLLAVVVGSVYVLAGFLTGPTVACEDSDAFDAVSRTFSYAGAGLPRLVVLRVIFFGGVLLGVSWRFVRTVLVIALALACLRVGAGADAIERATAVLGAMGTPLDADRLGIGAMDYVVALTMVLAFGGLIVLWIADWVSRVSCARVAVYLLLRRDTDHVPPDQLRTQPRASGHQDAEEAGFVEVTRVADE